MRLSAMSLFGTLTLFGCRPDSEETVTPTMSANVNDWIVPVNFNFNTTAEVQISIAAFDSENNPVRMPYVQVFDKDPKDGGTQLFLGGTDEYGKLEIVKSLPVALTSVVIVSNYVGVLNQVTVPVINNKVEYIFTPVASTGASLRTASSQALKGVSIQNQTAATGWNEQGVPNVLASANQWTKNAEEAVGDASFLQSLNAILPERKSLPAYHPEYLASGSQSNIAVSSAADVWVTFVAEGTNYTNTLGFYTYDLSSPPQSVNDINPENRHYIFPNMSAVGSGGGLVSGSSVYLGNFPANTGIGLFLAVNGWNSNTKSINTTSSYTIYSDPKFNPEANENQKQHCVLIKDQARETLIIGFEDMRRDNGGCDNDFNDALIIVSSNPVDAVLAGGIPSLPGPEADVDGDGVPNTLDAYPNDFERAYNNYASGSLAFEDQWPRKGDFDMNDFVVNYNYTIVTNAQNKTKDIKGTFEIAALGTIYHNGFGYELPLTPDDVQSVTGSKLNHNYVTRAGNGVEAGQEKATIIVFDDAFDLVSTPSFLNTDPKRPKYNTVSLPVDVTLTKPMDLPLNAPFNPFIMVGQQRGREVHLSGMAPTSKANTDLFGTADDATNLANGVYYKTKDNLPYGINVPEKFQYPSEWVSVAEAYLKLSEWVQSGGRDFADWYSSSKASSYRNQNKIYNK
ncbi:LruC domain-containing protein [Pontibacter silvestris]